MFKYQWLMILFDARPVGIMFASPEFSTYDSLITRVESGCKVPQEGGAL